MTFFFFNRKPPKKFPKSHCPKKSDAFLIIFKTKENKPFIAQPVIVSWLGGFVVAKSFADPSDFLGRISQGEAFGVMSKMQVLAVEDFSHIPRVTCVETYPGNVS